MNRRGFTLIELLLALSIFSVVIVMVYSVFSGGIRLSDRAKRDGDLLKEVRGTFSLIEKELQNAVLYNFQSSYPDLQAFIGEEDKITFLLASPDGLKVARYYLESPEDSRIYKIIIGETFKKNVAVTNSQRESYRAQYLIREEMDFVDYLNNRSANEDKIEIIATKVREDSLRFSYAYLSQAEGENIEWQSQWEGGDIPLGVRIEMEFLPSTENEKVLSYTKDVFIPHGIVWARDQG